MLLLVPSELHPGWWYTQEQKAAGRGEEINCVTVQEHRTVKEDEEMQPPGSMLKTQYYSCVQQHGADRKDYRIKK